METTRSGLPAVGEVPWGTHFCQFYRTDEDLADVLVPFFKAGLENNEQCIWITSEPLSTKKARAALTKAAPNLDERLKNGQIDIVDFGAWHLPDGEQDVDAVLTDWIARKERALARGYSGLRISGNTCWIETREQWRNFADYEAKANACFRKHRILAFCSYHSDRCTAPDAIEVVRNHHFAVVRQYGGWKVIENVSLKEAKDTLRKANEEEELERRVAERAAQLHESERRLHELLDALPAAVYTTDAAGRLTYYNQAAVELAGHRPTLGSDEWGATWRLYRPDGTPIPHDQRPMAVALKEDRPIRGEEAVAERPNGTRVPFIPFPTPLHDASGALAGAVNMLVDIGESKRAEEALRRNEAWLAGQKEAFQAAMNGAPLATSLGILVRTTIEQAESERRCAFYIADATETELRHVVGMPESYARCIDGFKIGPEAHACALAAYTAQPVITPDIFEEPRWKPWLRLAKEHDFRGCWSFPLKTSAGKRVGTFAMYFKEPRDATLRDRELAAAITHTASIIISRHQESEERARVSRELVESQQSLALELAAARRLQTISTELLGEQDVQVLYDKLVDAAASIMDSDCASMQMLYPERGCLRLLAWKSFDPASAAFWEWVRADSTTICGAALSSGRRIIIPDAENCAFMVGAEDLDRFRRSKIRAMQSTPLVSRSGTLLGIMSTHWREAHDPGEREFRLFDVLARQAADLIERRQAETALRELNDTLERKVEGRTRELETAMEERRKAEAALHHAQRLEAVAQLTGGVAHDFNNLLTVVVGQTDAITRAAEANDQIVRMTTAIQRAAERGARLTSQLLAFSRRQRLRPAVVTVDRLAADIDDLVRRAVGEAIEVEFTVDPDLWPTLVDPAQFESALLNLVINARDAMPEGGQIMIGARNAAVAGSEAKRLDLPPGDYVVVSVADTGTGMSPDVREHAFEPFFTTKDIGKGTGLGLAQIYGFAKQSGGAATIEGTMGHGTTVSLYLPRAEAPVVEDVLPPRETRPPEGRGKIVLVVEDQAEVREVIEISLKELGYRILTAPDGVAARKLLESNEPIDLLLTDMVMPHGVSGIGLAEAARRLRQDLKIVLVSGYSRDLGGHGSSIPDEFVFLEKPFRQAELADAIAAAFSGGQHRLDKTHSSRLSIE